MKEDNNCCLKCRYYEEWYGFCRFKLNFVSGSGCRFLEEVKK